MSEFSASRARAYFALNPSTSDVTQAAGKVIKWLRNSRCS